MPFTVIIDDPSGLSFIKNPFAPKLDSKMKIENYNRTAQQIEAMGYSVANGIEDMKEQEESKEVPEQKPLTTHKIDMTKPFEEEDFAKNEALVF